MTRQGWACFVVYHWRNREGRDAQEGNPDSLDVAVHLALCEEDFHHFSATVVRYFWHVPTFIFPLLSTILHKNMTASLSLKYANLMHLWCRSACFNLFWDLNKCVFYYMVQQTPFQSWTSILVNSWLVTDQISIASCILVLVTCDTRLKIQNRSELLQRAQASSISTHALGLDPWTLGLLPHPFPQNKLFLHQELKKCVHIIIPHICHFFYTDRIFKNQILHPKKRLRH